MDDAFFQYICFSSCSVFSLLLCDLETLIYLIKSNYIILLLIKYFRCVYEEVQNRDGREVIKSIVEY
jgi:hypothetical protein